MGMTILDRLLGHDAWTTRQLLLRCRELTDAQLDEEVDADHTTLRATFDHILGAMEVHTATLLGRTEQDGGREAREAREDRSLEGMLARHARIAKEFAACAARIEREGLGDTIVTSPWGSRRTAGAMVAHVITHSMHHRAQAMAIMDRLGLRDIIEGDVLGWESVARGWGWEDGGSTGRPVAG